MLARAFVAVQLVLPRHWLTVLVHYVARIRVRVIKNAMIRGYVRVYGVALDEVAKQVPGEFKTLNDFFTRELSTGCRPIDSGASSIVSPVDGTVCIASQIDDDSILQAKGLEYSLEELFAIDLDEARAYRNGSAATIYLAPQNYHRVHMPFAGKLVAAHYVPGDLFSVNSATVAQVRGIFRRNERLNMHFRTAFGPAALIFVGALNVGSISTPWTGEIRPRKVGVVETQKLDGARQTLIKGELLGWFNMGSTVILLLPQGVSAWDPSLAPGKSLRMGELIGTLAGADK